MNPKSKYVGFACTYTPLPLIEAAGFTPYRILPVGEWPDQAGHLLHDNLCPHIKRILDRVLADDIPDLALTVFMNSCDAMRRLHDAWQRIRPHNPAILLDLPATPSESSVAFFAGELARLVDTLSGLSGRPINPPDIAASIEKYNQLEKLLKDLHRQQMLGGLAGGRAELQKIFNRASTEAVEELIAELMPMATTPHSPAQQNKGVPIFLFGNVLADPEAFSFFESCGARVVDDDLCTGSRLFNPLDINHSQDIFLQIAESLLSQPPCARTFDPQDPEKMARDIVTRTRACNARAVIGHTIKFCDPYLARIPSIRETLGRENLPFLLLEGDCSLRSIGQQRTRVEAFIEMLG
ncbi:MAG: 2-hydroxyacyl-CoA dehydratase family protein [Deltaproteobacteria bacterium]|nr:2-hydroxyacyl-CoA dehydratase family protein [Deltaproteobacteria bacterium]